MNSVETRIDLQVYPELAIVKAAHAFTGQYFIEMQRDITFVVVKFTPKEPDKQASNILGAFHNELLDQKLRLTLADKTEPVRNLILAHALSGTDLLHPHLEQVEPATDPEHIAVPDKSTTTIHA